VAHPLPEVLLLVVCGTIADCDDFEGIAAWRKAHLEFLQREQARCNAHANVGGYGRPGDRCSPKIGYSYWWLRENTVNTMC
jgi:DDE_Tnp_1-associated